MSSPISGLPAAAIPSNLNVSISSADKSSLQPLTRRGENSFAGMLQQVAGGEQKKETEAPAKTPGSATGPSGSATESGGPRPENPGRAPGISGARLEQLRTDLMRNLSVSSEDAAMLDRVLPRLFEDRSRTTLLKEVMTGVRQSGSESQLQEILGQVENKWYELEQIMNSDNSLSHSQLIGLQARMYQVTQHIEVVSKVVDQMNSGVKTILNTNL